MNDIKALLEKYYNGETSLDEERQIRDYFALHPEEKATPDAMLSGAIQAVKQDESKTLPLKPRRTLFKYLALGGSALAAGLALLIGLRQTPQIRQSQPVQQAPATQQTIASVILAIPKVSGEVQDEQQALELARKTLAYMSSKLNKGIAGMNQLNKLEQSISKIQNKEKS